MYVLLLGRYGISKEENQLNILCRMQYTVQLNPLGFIFIIQNLIYYYVMKGSFIMFIS